MQEDLKMQNAFRIVTKYLERFGDETITLKDLHELMIDEWSDNDTVKNKWKLHSKSLW